MPGKFICKKGSTGKFRFVLVSQNGQVIATSQSYSTKAACMNGIRAVRRIAADAPLEDQSKPLPKAASAKASPKKPRVRKAAAGPSPAAAAAPASSADSA